MPVSSPTPGPGPRTRRPVRGEAAAAASLIQPPRITLVSMLVDHRSGDRVEDQRSQVWMIVEHVVQCSGDHIERLLLGCQGKAGRAQPVAWITSGGTVDVVETEVVLDEAQHGGLIRQ